MTADLIFYAIVMIAFILTIKATIDSFIIIYQLRKLSRIRANDGDDKIPPPAKVKIKTQGNVFTK